MVEKVPDSLLANRSDKVLHMWLCEVLIIIMDQFGVNSWHGHEHINHWSLEAQKHLPHLGTKTERKERKITY